MQAPQGMLIHNYSQLPLKTVLCSCLLACLARQQSVSVSVMAAAASAVSTLLHDLQLICVFWARALPAIEA